MNNRYSKNINNEKLKHIVAPYEVSLTDIFNKKWGGCYEEKKKTVTQQAPWIPGCFPSPAYPYWYAGSS